MDIIDSTILNRINNPDTLRYFYSSVFQGFAAIVAISVSFILFTFSRFASTKDTFLSLLEDTKEKIPGDYLKKHFDEIENIGIYKFFKVHCDDPELNIDVSYIRNNEIFKNLYNLDKVLEDLKQVFYMVLRKSILVLIISLIGLFLIGYDLYINIALLLLGVFIIILSINFLMDVKGMYKLIMMLYKSD